MNGDLKIFACGANWMKFAGGWGSRVWYKTGLMEMGFQGGGPGSDLDGGPGGVPGREPHFWGVPGRGGPGVPQNPVCIPAPDGMLLSLRRILLFNQIILFY